MKVRTFLGLVAALAALAVMSGSANSAVKAENPAVWIGSPIGGSANHSGSVKATWGVKGYPDTIPPYHHLLAKALPANDWSVDLPLIPSTQTDKKVYVYAAPQNTALNNSITARISQIIDNKACKNGGGGDLVTVEVRYGSKVIGQVTYAHLDRDAGLYYHKTIPRWGGYLGKVAVLPESNSGTGGSNCWTGPHVHLELRASQHYACWNKGYRLAYRVDRTNFVGFISGSFLHTTASNYSGAPPEVNGWRCP